MRSGKSLYDRETNLVKAVCQFINLISIVVVRDYSQRTGQDTKSGINQSFRNTL